MAQAGRRLQRETRPFSARPEDAWKYMLAGEGARLGTNWLVSNPVAKAVLGKAQIPLDIASNMFGAVSATAAGDDRYGRSAYNHGVLDKVSPTGVDAGSMTSDAIESIISAGQFYPATAIPAFLLSGELTKAANHRAKMDDVPRLDAIAAGEGQYADIENRVRDAGIMNAAPNAGGALGAWLWDDLRGIQKELIDRELADVKLAISSGDKARIDAAALRIPEIVDRMKGFNADIQAVESGPEAYTLPVKRMGEAIADEYPNSRVHNLFSPQRFIDTLSGSTNNYGFTDYFNPNGRNMKEHLRKQEWANPPKRTQGAERLDELHKIAVKSVGDPLAAQARKRKELAYAEESAGNFDPGYGFYQ